MPFRVEITPEAEQDADSILEWLLSEDAGETGLRWFLKMREAIASLAHLPGDVHWLLKTNPFRLKCANCFMATGLMSTASCLPVDAEVVHVFCIWHGRSPAGITAH